MKVLAAGAVRDGDDLRFLLGHLDITSSAEVRSLTSCFERWGISVSGK
jgi:hypothetical protein